jgi:hypothetical protein
MLTNEDSLVNMDPGLNRRFALRLHLPDYDCDELAEICERQATLYGLELEEGLKPAIAQLIREQHTPEEISQNNGGLSVKMTEEAFRRLASRIVDGKKQGNDPTAKTLILADYKGKEEGGSAGEGGAKDGTAGGTSGAVSPPADGSVVPATMEQLLKKLAPEKATKWAGWIAKLADEDVDTPMDLQGMTYEGIERMQISAYLKDLLLQAWEKFEGNANR